ncbi:MAG: DNA polymerase Y family protein, partial [Acidimicrobiia bacterium]|nr:DNA polymerase Y family protein [Acidimicrobiia bacterium]
MNAAGDLGAVRTLVARCIDWSIIAAGRRPDEPAAVLRADRVLATSPAARIEGVRRGQRRRDAQRRCPELIVLDPDPERESRVFASIVALVDRFTPRVELSAPGRLAFPVRGPSRLFGGDDALARLVADELSATLGSEGWADAVGVGVADGVFAAERAASVAVGRSDRTCVVAPGDSAAFLAPLPVSVLGDRV